MNTIIRRAEAKDVPAMLALVKELAAFERAPDAVWNTEEAMLRDGFGDTPAFSAYVAEYDNEVVGLCLYHPAYSTWKGKYLYLDDLYVKEAVRGKGIGKELIEAFLQEAKQQGVSLVKWQVLHWNEPAIEMYKKMGVTFDKEWIDCKLYFEK